MYIIAPAVTLMVAAAGFLLLNRHTEQPISLVEGRSVIAWLSEVDIGIGKPQANRVLYAAGPRIVPELERVAARSEFYVPILDRLPRGWFPQARADARKLQETKVNAAYVIGVIAYQNPGAPEAIHAVPVLVRGLKGRRGEMRFICAQSLAAIGSPASNAIPALIVSSRDANSSVRKCALDALGRIGIATPEALSAIRVGAEDTDAEVRWFASKAMERLRDGGKGGRF